MKKTALFIILLLVGSLLFAQGHGRKRGNGQKKGRKNHGMQMILNDRLLEDVGVSEKIRAEIRKGKHEVRRKMQDIQFKIKELRVVSRKEIQSKKHNVKKLKNYAAKIAEFQKQRILLMEYFKIDTLTKLTLDQRTKIMKKMEEKRLQLMERMRGRHQ